MHIFTLPLDNPFTEKPEVEENSNPNESVVDIKLEKQNERDPIIRKIKKEYNEEFISHRYEPTKISLLNRLIFTFSMVFWHILLFIVITFGLYAGFHYGFNTNEKKILLDAFSFLYDWRPLVFFLGIYMSYTVKKVGDISAVSFTSFLIKNKITH
jgi:hypothetical protein